MLEYTLEENGKPVDKLAVFTYFPRWDWVIVGTLPMAEVTEDVISVVKRMIAPIIIAMLILLAVTFFVMKFMLVNPLNRFIGLCSDLTTGDGDLTKKINIESRDELGTLAGEFNIFIENVREIIEQVKIATSEVASGNNQLAATMEELSTIFEQQAGQVSNVSDSMYEIRCVSDETTDSLNQTRGIITETDSRTGEGQNNLHMVVDSIHVIERRAKSLSDTIETLAEATNEIDEMLNVINDIAGQTNLLALNASIEAARAGEAGRGFAVVADEVRKLAERTQSSTLKIAEITTRVKAIPKEASKEVQDTLVSVGEGVERSSNTGKFFEQIVTLVNQINDSSISMVQKLADQCDMIEQKSDAVKEVATGIDESNKAVAEVTNTVHHLQNMTEGLKMLVERFKV
jgi:methyl-accepting chemotaxis protein